MKIINFINPTQDEEMEDAYRDLVHCCVCGYDYEQTNDILNKHGYYIPKDQFELFNRVIDIQIDLDIGARQGEWK